MSTVCFCNSNIPWGGGESWHLNAARSLAARGWRVLLLCHPDGALYQRACGLEELETLPIPNSRFSFLNPFARKRLGDLFRTRAVDALIVNLPADLKIAGPAAHAAGVKHVIYRRGSALPVKNSFLNRYLFGKVITRLIVNSTATKKQALARNADLIPQERISVIPNGFDVPAFDSALEAANEAPRLAPERRFVIGNAGRLNRQKGQHLLLHLGKKLVDAGLDLGMVIAGEGEREQELKNLAAQLGLNDRVTFCGFLEDLSPVWRDTDLFVLTSLWEGFGNVVIEAMLARKPVFAFAVSNLPELVIDGPAGNGRLFPLPEAEAAGCPEDAPAKAQATAPQNTGQDGLDAMAEAVLDLAKRPDEALRMGEAGRAFALKFSQDSCMDMLEKLIR